MTQRAGGSKAPGPKVASKPGAKAVHCRRTGHAGGARPLRGAPGGMAGSVGLRTAPRPDQTRPDQTRIPRVATKRQSVRSASFPDVFAHSGACRAFRSATALQPMAVPQRSQTDSSGCIQTNGPAQAGSDAGHKDTARLSPPKPTPAHRSTARRGGVKAARRDHSARHRIGVRGARGWRDPLHPPDVPPLPPLRGPATPRPCHQRR